MIIASLYSKPVNKSIAFHYGQKNNGYSAFIPNTRYLVYQPRLTDAIIVIFGLLSYEHPCKERGLSAYSHERNRIPPFDVSTVKTRLTGALSATFRSK